MQTKDSKVTIKMDTQTLKGENIPALQHYCRRGVRSSIYENKRDFLN